MGGEIIVLSNTERLAAMGDEIEELEERLIALRAEQQELEAEQQQDQTITVGNLA